MTYGQKRLNRPFFKKGFSMRSSSDNSNRRGNHIQKIRTDFEEMDINAARIGCITYNGKRSDMIIKGTINGLNVESLIDTNANYSTYCYFRKKS